MSDLSFDAIRDQLVECSDGEALLADGLEDALIGMAEGWFGNSHRVVALYDLSICVRVLMSWGMDEEEAEEYIGYNVTGAYVGPSTPVFAVILRYPVIVSGDEGPAMNQVWEAVALSDVRRDGHSHPAGLDLRR